MPCLSFEGKRVYLACDATDMRKSFNGLAAIVEADFDLDPLSGALFVFCNRSRCIIKILEWDGDGFWIYMKTLENTRFRWPDARPGEGAMELTPEEMRTLVDGPKFEQRIKRKTLFR